jgi:hypothetical protein
MRAFVARIGQPDFVPRICLMWQMRVFLALIFDRYHPSDINHNYP